MTTFSSSARWRSWVVQCLLLAGSYWLTGRLGLLLAIPPGNATAIWPPTGIALGALLLGGMRLVPGVWLGSFLIILSAPTASFSSADIVRTFSLACVVGLGASLQAIVACLLIRRFVSDLTLIRESQVVRFLFFAGPVSCLVSATIGVTALWAYGLISSRDYAFNWWNWWVGDAIGAFSVAPIILLYLGEPRELMRKRRLVVAGPLMVGLALSILIFLWADQYEKARLKQEFQIHATEMTHALQDRIDTLIEVLQSLGAYLTIHPNTDSDRFSRFAQNLLERRPLAAALAWAPVVRQRERERFETDARLVHGRFYRICQEDASRQIRTAPPRAEYLPVLHVEPLVGNTRALGFDLRSEPIRRDTLRRAEVSRTVAATPPVNLLSDPTGPLAIVAFLPIRSLDRSEEIRGYAVLLIRLQPLIEQSWGRFRNAGISCRLEDRSDPSQSYPVIDWVVESGEANPAGRMTLTLQAPVAGRLWDIHYSTTPTFLLNNRSMQAWSVLAGGALFSGLLGAFLLVFTGHTAVVELEVDRRTAELAHANEDLRRARDNAEAASKAKSEFLAVVSHELRTPLNGILGMVELVLDESHSDELRQKVEIIQISGKSLLATIDDLLSVSRLEAGQVLLQPRKYSLSRQLSEWVHKHRPAARRKGLELHLLLSCDLPAVVLGDPTPLGQVLDHLLDNAIKFTARGRISVRVRTEWLTREETHLLFEIEDTGMGIPIDKQQEIFAPFVQVDMSSTRRHGGTGLGLTIADRLIRLLGGKLELRSKPNVGSVFFFRLSFRIVQSSTAEIASPILKIDEVRARFAGRADLFADAVTLFQTRRTDIEQQLDQATLAADASAIANIVRQAAESTAVFNAHHVPVAASLVEDAVARGNWAEIQAAIRELIFAFDMLQTRLAELT